MKRTPLRRKTPLKRTKFRTSKRILARMDDYTRRRLWFIDVHRDWCRLYAVEEECMNPKCRRKMFLQVGHVQSRARAPHRKTDPTNLQRICGQCNEEMGSREVDYRPKSFVLFVGDRVHRDFEWNGRRYDFKQGEQDA